MPAHNPDYYKKYYEDHKDIMRAQIKTTSDKLVECITCKKNIKKGSMQAHKLTKMHNYIVNQLAI